VHLEAKTVDSIGRPGSLFFFPEQVLAASQKRRKGQDHEYNDEVSSASLRRSGRGGTHIHIQTHTRTHMQTYARTHATHIARTHDVSRTHTHAHTHIYTTYHTYPHTPTHQRSEYGRLDF